MAHSNDSSDDENNLHISDNTSKPKGSPKDEHSSDEEEQPLYKVETAQIISQWMQDEKKKKEFIIIDVRGNDYNSSKLKGSINIPHDKIREDGVIKKLIEDNKNVKNIIYHCTQGGSLSRSSAQYYAQYRTKKYQQYPPQNVIVLEGGYNNFSKNYSNLLGPVNANNTFKDSDYNNKSDNPFDNDAFGENLFDNNDPFSNNIFGNDTKNKNDNTFGTKDAFSNDFNGFDDFDFGNDNKNQNANKTEKKDKKNDNDKNELFGDFESE